MPVIHKLTEDYFKSMNFTPIPNVWLDSDTVKDKDCKSQVYDMGEMNSIRLVIFNLKTSINFNVKLHNKRNTIL